MSRRTAPWRSSRRERARERRAGPAQHKLQLRCRSRGRRAQAPRRTRGLESSLAEWNLAWLSQAQNPAILCRVGAGAGEVVEGFFRHADDVFADECSAFARAVFGMLDAAFPLDDGPP